MCSIFGIAFQEGCSLTNNGEIIAFLNRLFCEAKSRGTHASGLALTSTGGINVIKKNVPADVFITLPEYKETLDKYGKIFCGLNKNRPISIMGHCRFETQGSRKNNVNNHPIVREKVVGVHNGIISNDHQLFSKHSNNFGRFGQVDSEIIFALVEYYSESMDIGTAIRRACTEMTGSYACSMVHNSHPHLLWLFRNTSPCTVYHFVESGFIVWASMEQQLIWALNDVDFGEIETIPFNTNNALSIDLYRNKIKTSFFQ